MYNDAGMERYFVPPCDGYQCRLPKIFTKKRKRRRERRENKKSCMKREKRRARKLYISCLKPSLAAETALDDGMKVKLGLLAVVLVIRVLYSRKYCAVCTVPVRM